MLKDERPNLYKVILYLKPTYLVGVIGSCQKVGQRIKNNTIYYNVCEIPSYRPVLPLHA